MREGTRSGLTSLMAVDEMIRANKLTQLEGPRNVGEFGKTQVEWPRNVGEFGENGEFGDLTK